MSLGCYLLYLFYYYLFKIDAHRKLNFLYRYSEKDNKPVILKNTDIQLAENCIEFSETTRQISDLKGKNLKGKDLENFFKEFIFFGVKNLLYILIKGAYPVRIILVNIYSYL